MEAEAKKDQQEPEASATDPAVSDILSALPKTFDEIPDDAKKMVEDMAAGLIEADPQLKPKRRRGRPRKSETQSDTGPQDEVGDEESPTSKPPVLRGVRRAKKFRVLEDRLAELLAMPGVLFVQAGDEFCATHFMVRGPELAAKLVTVAESSEAVERFLTRVANGTSIISVALAVVTYLLPPAIHHGLPVPDSIRNFYGSMPPIAVNGTPSNPAAAAQA
jgi:hypothetical protein